MIGYVEGSYVKLNVKGAFAWFINIAVTILYSSTKLNFIPKQNSNKCLLFSLQSKALIFRGISRLGSAFIFLHWFNLVHICIQVTTLHMWNKQGIYCKDFIKNRFYTTIRLVNRNSYSFWLQKEVCSENYLNSN